MTISLHPALRSALAAVAATLGLILLSGCGPVGQVTQADDPPSSQPSNQPPNPQPTSAPVDPDAILATVEVTGGYCMSPCDASLLIRADGDYKARRGGREINSTLTAKQLADLHDAAVAEDLRAHPKDGHFCPSFVDGQDLAIAYRPDPSQPFIKASSCDYDFDRSRLVSNLTRLIYPDTDQATDPTADQSSEVR